MYNTNTLSINTKKIQPPSENIIYLSVSRNCPTKLYGEENITNRPLKML